jgi:hypothetical protein
MTSLLRPARCRSMMSVLVSFLDADAKFARPSGFDNSMCWAAAWNSDTAKIRVESFLDISFSMGPGATCGDHDSGDSQPGLLTE